MASFSRRLRLLAAIAACKRTIREAQAEIDAAYWRFTRQARGVPPVVAVPDAYARKKEAEQELRALKGPKLNCTS